MIFTRALNLFRKILQENSDNPLLFPLLLIRAVKRGPIKQYRIGKYQKNILKNKYSANTKKLIIFITPSQDKVNGGILSISSLCEETAKLRHVHEAEVVLCTGPGQRLLLRYTKFNNHNHIFGFSQILSYFRNLESLIIHVPEYQCQGFTSTISKKDYSILGKVAHIHINIMLQNIKGLPSLRLIKSIGKLGKVTCTTAHQKYSSSEMRERVGVPLHIFSTWLTQGGYNRVKYVDKSDLMIVSPDSHPKKAEVLSIIRRQLPQLEIRIIKDLTYEEYKKLIGRAKWAITFGEGLDGYFVETIFSGGISFAVYNTTYFTEDFRVLRTVYDDYESLIERICSDIKNIDNQMMYEEYQDIQYNICREHYDYGQYVKNMELFYKGDYTYK
jgi:hypothetical protein